MNAAVSHSQHSVHVLVKPSTPLVRHENNFQQPDHTQQLAKPIQDGCQHHVLPLPPRPLRSHLRSSSNLGRPRKSRLPVQHSRHRPEHPQADLNNRPVRSRPRHPNRPHASPERRPDPKRPLQNPNPLRRAALSFRLRTACPASRILDARMGRATFPRTGPGRLSGCAEICHPLH